MGVPGDRCGATYADEEADSSCCYRETWGDRERCVWHAAVDDDEHRPAATLRAARADPEIRELNAATGPDELLDDVDIAETTLPEGLDLSGVSLREADLRAGDARNVDLRGADLRESDLTNADLRGSDLRETDCWDATFREAHFGDADFRSADLREVDWSGATLRGADLSGTDMEAAVLDRADLFDADLSDVRLYGAVLGSARANEATTLDERCVYDPLGAEEYDPDVDETGPGPDPLTKAASTYEELEKLCAANALLDEQGQYFVRRQDIHTTQRRDEGDWGRWLRARVSRAVVLYGESPFRVVAAAAAVILGAALLYPLGLLRDTASGDLVTYPPPSEPVALVSTLLDSLYFSTLTFTTMTYGSFVPVGAGRFLTMVETASGVILIALLVFVFGRRATR
jgi:hypothetical protein